jgi:hydrogenase maturation protease
MGRHSHFVFAWVPEYATTGYQRHLSRNRKRWTLDMKPPEIMILGIGCTLFSDEGLGIHVIDALRSQYDFNANVEVVDGGLLGVNLLGYISGPDHLIVIDAIRNGGQPGDLYRLTGVAISERMRAKNSVHQIDFLEALAHCQALDHVPETFLIGVEPDDIATLACQLTSTLKPRVAEIMAMVLKELDNLGAGYRKKAGANADSPVSLPSVR